MSKKSKWLYHFKVSKKVEEEIEIDPVINEDGEEIKQFKKIKKDKPVKCAILKPSRSLYEEGELFYSVELSKYIQAGMLTKTLLAKRFANDGGTLTDADQERYAGLYSALHDKEQEVQRIQLDTENAKKRAKKLQDLIIEITSIRQQLVEFESTQSALFDQTAEHKARNRTILWWTLNLAHVKEEDDEEFKPLFEGSTFHDKLDSYDSIEEGEEFQEDQSQYHISVAVKKSAYFTSFWYSGQATDKESFDSADRLLEEVDVFNINDDRKEVEKTDDIVANAVQKQYELEKEAVQEDLEEELEEINKEVEEARKEEQELKAKKAEEENKDSAKEDSE